MPEFTIPTSGAFMAGIWTLRAGALALMLTTGNTLTQAQPAAQRIMLVHMGGNDCPPCIAWRVTELPKLQQTPEFQRISFVLVTKAIDSAVPPRWALPDIVKPLKDKLDAAGNGMSGSPQVALLVDGEVHDYFWGARSTEAVVEMIRAVENGTRYPYLRCLKKLNRDTCLVSAP